MSESTPDFSFQNTAPTSGPIPAHEYIAGGRKMHGILFKLGKLPRAKMASPRRTSHQTRKKHK